MYKFENGMFITDNADVVEDATVNQKTLERSNVDIYESVYDIMRMNASMLSSFRLLKVVDDIYTKSINLRQ